MADLPLSDHCFLREDGTVFPPVTPEVPAPPGYASPLDEVPSLANITVRRETDQP